LVIRLLEVIEISIKKRAVFDGFGGCHQELLSDAFDCEHAVIIFPRWQAK